MGYYILNGRSYDKQFPVDAAGNCIVPNGVTEISGWNVYNNSNISSNNGADRFSSAFSGCPVNIRLPSSLRTIGVCAFKGSGIKKIDIPESVTFIGKYAFLDSKLEEVTIPSSVKRIEEGAFCGCKSLKRVKLPQGLTYIDKAAFMDCESLEEIVLPEGISCIDKYAFMNSGLKTLNIPASIAEINERTFANCKNLETLNLASGLRKIGAAAFANNYRLSAVDIPDSVYEICNAAFINCVSLQNVKTGCDRISETAFAGCVNLKTQNLIKEIDSKNSDLYIGMGEVFGMSTTSLRGAEVPVMENLSRTTTDNSTSAEDKRARTRRIEIFKNAGQECEQIAKDVHIKSLIEEQMCSSKRDNTADLELTLRLNSLQSTILTSTSSKIGEVSAATDTAIGKLEEKIHGREVLTDEAIESLKAENKAIREQLERQTKLFNDLISGNKLSEIGGMLPEIEQEIKEQVYQEVKEYERKKANTEKSDEIRLALKAKIGVLDREAVEILHRQQPDDTVFCMPDWVCKVSSGAFENAEWLEMVKIGRNVRVICKDAFKDCKNLTDVNGFEAESLRTICANAFCGCDNVDADFPEAEADDENGLIIENGAFPASCSVRGGSQSKNPLEIRVKMPLKQLNSESNKGQSLRNNLEQVKTAEQKKSTFGFTPPKVQNNNGFGIFGGFGGFTPPQEHRKSGLDSF